MSVSSSAHSITQSLTDRTNPRAACAELVPGKDVTTDEDAFLSLIACSADFVP